MRIAGAVIALLLVIWGCNLMDPFDEPLPVELQCLDPALARNTVWWPTLAGTRECPLPADHPKCLASPQQDPWCVKP